MVKFYTLVKSGEKLIQPWLLAITLYLMKRLAIFNDYRLFNDLNQFIQYIR